MKHFHVLLVEGSENDARVVQDMLAEFDGQPFVVTYASTLGNALDELASRRFDVVLVDISLQDSDRLNSLEVIRRHAPSLPAVVLAAVKSDVLAMAAVERGAQDFLVKGRITPEALVRVLQFAVARQQSVRPSQPERVAGAMFGVLGVKGGVGGTTLACNLAAELARQQSARVLLADFDAGSASSSFLMKVNSKYSLADAAANLHRLDADYLSAVVAASPYAVDVLQAPGAVAVAEPINQDHALPLLRLLRPHYRYVVVDLGRPSPTTMSVLAEFQELFLVATSDLLELYEAGRVLKLLRSLGRSTEHVRLVLNRVSKAGMASIPDLERAIGCPAYWTIPDCTAELAEAYSAGRFLDARLSLRRQVGQMAERFLGREGETKASSLGPFSLRRLARVLRGANAAGGAGSCDARPAGVNGNG